MKKPLDKLKYHVTGAIERGEKTAIEAVTIKYATETALNEAKQILNEYAYKLKDQDLYTEIIDQITAKIEVELYKELKKINDLKTEFESDEIPF